MRRAALSSSLALSAMLGPKFLAGQTGITSAADAIAAFGRNASDPSVAFPSEEAYPGAGMVDVILVYPERYSEAKVDSILDGLRQLASTLPTPSARMRATVELTNAGSRELSRGFSVVSRTREAYAAALELGDTGVQAMIIRMMSIQQEESAAIAFLESVARDAQTAQAQRALLALESMGPEGEEALRRLDETGAVSDPVARDGLRRALAPPPPRAGPGGV